MRAEIYCGGLDMIIGTNKGCNSQQNSLKINQNNLWLLKKVYLVWVPVHQGTKGNEKADDLARRALKKSRHGTNRKNLASYGTPKILAEASHTKLI